MKNLITLFAALLLGTTLLTAQINYAFDEGDTYGDGTQNMIGQREYKWDVDTLNWDNTDSFNMQYNGQDRLVLRNYFAPATATTWRNKQISQRLYDANGLLLLQVDTSSNPTIGDRYEFTYSGTGKEIQKLDKLWNAGSWQNYRKYTTTYTAFDKVNVYLTEGWNFGNSVWQNSNRIIHIYNAQNLDSIYTYQTWNTGTSQWDEAARNFYTYDANGNILSNINEEFDALQTVYKPNYKLEYTYDGSNRMTGYIESDWNINTNLWEFKWKYTYTYNGQGFKSQDLNEKWSTTNLQWDLWTLTLYTYDANNRPVEEVYQNWATSAWENSGRNTYTRDAHGYRTRYLVEFWNSNTLAWRNFGAIDYWYGLRNIPISGITEQVADEVNVFPNPSSSPVFFVNAQTELPYQIYDLSGRLIKSGELNQGTNSIILDEAKGLYLLKAGNSTTKIVKQ